jgi:hypothetical protein
MVGALFQTVQTLQANVASLQQQNGALQKELLLRVEVGKIQAEQIKQLENGETVSLDSTMELLALRNNHLEILVGALKTTKESLKVQTTLRLKSWSWDCGKKPSAEEQRLQERIDKLEKEMKEFCGKWSLPLPDCIAPPVVIVETATPQASPPTGWFPWGWKKA